MYGLRTENPRVGGSIRPWAPFFPRTLLFCVFVYGLEDTKYICLALIHDALKTFLGVVSILLPILALIIFIIFMVVE